ARKRNVITDHGPQASAVTAVKIAYQRIEYWKIVRRPIRSASRPSTSEPQSEPAKAALFTSPCIRPVRPHCAAKIGATKPTSRISIALNIQAAPVTRMAFLWKRERPPSRRTCSTSRAGTVTVAVVIFGYVFAYGAKTSARVYHHPPGPRHPGGRAAGARGSPAGAAVGAGSGALSRRLVP